MSTTRLTRLLGWGLTILVAVMPFHAFLSVWLGSLMGHEAAIQAWKEVLLAILALGGIILVIADQKARARLKNPLALAVLALALVAAIITAVDRPSLTAVAFGAKTDLEFLLAFLLAWLVADRALVRRLTGVILATSVVVVGFGIAEAYLLPSNFLTHFGYGPSTVAPFQTITSGISSLRFPSTLGGANQLGAYLILPLCLALALAMKRRSWWWLLLPTGLVVLYNTFSRSAWLGALVALGITAYLVADRVHRPRFIIGAVVGLVALIGLVGFGLSKGDSVQYIVLHSSVVNHNSVGSDFQHGESLTNGTAAIVKAPLGHGLGTAGPATFHAGTTNIIEDYYLQLGYEAGIIGALLFLTILFLLIRALLVIGDPIATATAAAIIGVGLTALVLPAWTDSSMALVVWTYAGGLLGRVNEAEYV